MTWWELYADFLQMSREYRTTAEITPLWFLRIASGRIADIQHYSRLLRETRVFPWDAAQRAYVLDSWVWVPIWITLRGEPVPGVPRTYPVLPVSPQQAQEIEHERRLTAPDTPRQWWRRFGGDEEATTFPFFQQQGNPRVGYMVPGIPPLLRVEPEPESWATEARVHYVVRYVPLTQREPRWAGAFTDTESWMQANQLPVQLWEHAQTILWGVMAVYALQGANSQAASLYQQLYVEGRELITRMRPPETKELVSPYAASPFD